MQEKKLEGNMEGGYKVLFIKRDVTRMERALEEETAEKRGSRGQG